MSEQPEPAKIPGRALALMICLALAAGLVVGGVAMLSIPAALVVGGILLALLAMLALAGPDS